MRGEEASVPATEPTWRLGAENGNVRRRTLWVGPPLAVDAAEAGVAGHAKRSGGSRHRSAPA
jgi:hypothetical protein